MGDASTRQQKSRSSLSPPAAPAEGRWAAKPTTGRRHGGTGRGADPNPSPAEARLNRRSREAGPEGVPPANLFPP